jgi:hypothetical protein
MSINDIDAAILHEFAKQKGSELVLGENIGLSAEAARAMNAPNFTAVDIATADADGFRNGRASVVVELPELRGAKGGYQNFDLGRDEGIEECRAAIIAAGGSIKE